MFDPMAYFEYGRYQGLPVDCRSAMTAAYIDHAASVWICHRFKIGSLLDEDISSIWSGEVAHGTRKSLFDERNICLNCQYYWQCINTRDRDLLGNVDLLETTKSLSNPNRQIQLICRVDPDSALNPDGGKIGIFRWGETYYAAPWHKKHTLNASEYHRSDDVINAQSLEALLARIRTTFQPLH